MNPRGGVGEINYYKMYKENLGELAKDVLAAKIENTWYQDYKTSDIYMDGKKMLMHCKSCGFIGDFPNTCPVCGGSDIRGNVDGKDVTFSQEEYKQFLKDQGFKIELYDLLVRVYAFGKVFDFRLGFIGNLLHTCVRIKQYGLVNGLKKPWGKNV